MPRFKQDYFTSNLDHSKIYYNLHHYSNKVCLVFLHGLGGNHTAWNPIRKHFHRLRISTLALDLRGHGLSDRPQTKKYYQIRYQSQDLHDLLKSLPYHRYIVIGHCFGGIISMTTAALYPRLFTAQVLVDTSAFLPLYAQHLYKFLLFKKTINFLIHRSFNPYRSQIVDYTKFMDTGDWDIRRLSTDILHTSLKSYLYSFDSITGFDATKLLSKVTIPTLILSGDADTVFPPYLSQHLHQRIKRSFLQLLPDENHIVLINHPQTINTAINKFFLTLDLL